MSTIHVEQSHTFDRAEARRRLMGFETLLQKYKVALAWAGDKATIKGLGVSGGVEIADQKVVVDVQLGMLARAAGVDGAKLKETIERRLREAYTG